MDVLEFFGQATKIKMRPHGVERAGSRAGAGNMVWSSRSQVTDDFIQASVALPIKYKMRQSKPFVFLGPDSSGSQRMSQGTGVSEVKYSANS